MRFAPLFGLWTLGVALPSTSGNVTVRDTKPSILDDVDKCITGVKNKVLEHWDQGWDCNPDRKIVYITLGSYKYESPGDCQNSMFHYDQDITDFKHEIMEKQFESSDDGSLGPDSWYEVHRKVGVAKSIAECYLYFHWVPSHYDIPPPGSW
ncbi:hypothetical protein F4778DRAFT_696076 [Xylariomycetidae sp. FL2044]|nr:hypothetical protein F4778DRAFT_696076 [Xylariomycetidae sp. FL2044]